MSFMQQVLAANKKRLEEQRLLEIQGEIKPIIEPLLEQLIAEIEEPTIVIPVTLEEKPKREKRQQRILAGYSSEYAAKLFLSQVDAMVGGDRKRGVVVGSAFSLPDQQFVLVVMIEKSKIATMNLENAVSREKHFLHPTGYTLWTQERVEKIDFDGAPGLIFLRVDSESDGHENHSSYSGGVAMTCHTEVTRLVGGFGE